MARLMPLALAISPARVDRGLGAGDHHLARRIVVGDDADAAGRGGASFASSSACSISAPISALMPPSPTGTADCIAWPRDLQQARRVGQREGAGGAERGIFAERMAGDQARMLGEIEAAFLFQHAHHRHATPP